jgi:transcriptional regulator with XRE-family HTH domain
MKTLREWRLDKLLSIGELARRSGLTKKSIIDLEYGRRPSPHFETIRRICDVLEVRPSEVTEFAQALEERSKDAA